MASLETEFQAEGHKPISFGAVPGGVYELVVVNSEVKDTNNNDGKYASFDIQIISEGEGNNRHVFQNITLVNKSEKAMEIGKRQLADLCRACGKSSIQDTAELHDIPFWGKVGIEKGKGDYPDKNKIDQFYPAGQTGPAKAAAGQQATPATQQRVAAPPQQAKAAVTTGSATPPWRRK